MEFFFVEGDLRVRSFVLVRVSDVGVKRKLPADDLELTLGNSTLRALSEGRPA